MQKKLMSKKPSRRTAHLQIRPHRPSDEPDVIAPGLRANSGFPAPVRAIRIGLLVPAGNTTFEPDFASVLPSGATLHAHRISTQKTYAAESFEAMEDINSGLPEAAVILSKAKVQIIAYGFATATFFRGIDYARNLERLIAEASGAKAVVPSLALLDALAHLSAKRISVVTPYPAWNNQVLREFLGETQHKILSFVGDKRPLEEVSKRHLWHQPPEEITNYVTSNCHREADCLLCPCTAWRIFEVVEQIEERLGIPVITANQATIWKVFKEIRMQPSSKVGTLMRS